MSNDIHSTRDRIQYEQIKTLLAQSPPAVFAHLFYGTGVAILLWDRASHVQLIAWLGFLGLASVLRIVISRRFLRLAPAPSKWRSWAFLTSTLITLLGLIWGIGAVLFLDMSDPITMVVIVPVIVGLFSAASAISAPYPLSFYGFGATAYLPMVWVFLSSGTTIGVALTVFAVASLITHPMICLEVNRMLERSLRLGFENEALRSESERANAAKTRFLAAASHDLRQPIHALGLSFATLADKTRNTDTQPIIDQVEGAIDAVDSMLNSLLDISKLDAGVVTPKPEPVAVSTFFRQLKNEFYSTAVERENRLTIRNCNAWVQSDLAMLQRILSNLLGNALRYTTGGRILVAARRRGEKIRFEVRDTGIGIPEDSFEDIFVEFQQLGNPERDRRQGLGLGLAIVKRLAGLLGHPIGVSSIQGRGSCFWIEVPLATELNFETFPTQEINHQLLNPLRDARILVIDDERTILQSMRNLLEQWGCKVATATTIDEAELAVHSQSPDLLIADYRLTGERTGLDAVYQLRNVIGVNIPALIITGDTAPARLREARDSGLPLLHKPVQPLRLRSTIQHLVGCGTTNGRSASD